MQLVNIGYGNMAAIGRVVAVDMIRCLDIGCLCARINIHKT